MTVLLSLPAAAGCFVTMDTGYANAAPTQNGGASFAVRGGFSALREEGGGIGFASHIGAEGTFADTGSHVGLSIGTTYTLFRNVDYLVTPAFRTELLIRGHAFDDGRTFGVTTPSLWLGAIIYFPKESARRKAWMLQIGPSVGYQFRSNGEEDVFIWSITVGGGYAGAFYCCS